MPRQTAVDIGNDTISLVDLGMKGTGFVLRRWRVKPLGEAGLLPSGEGKTSLVARKVKEAAREARVALSGSVVSLSGRAGTIRYQRVPPMSAWRLDMYVRYEAGDQEGRAGSSCFDHRVLALPYMPGQMVVLIGIAQEQASEERFSMLAQAGAGDVELDLATTAGFNAYSGLHGTIEGKTTLYLDIGAEETQVIIERNGNLFFARTLTAGSRRITQALAQALSIKHAEAEALKRETGVLTDHGSLEEDRRKAAAVILSEASGLASNVESSIMFAQSQTLQKNLRPDRLVLAGGGAELPGLAEFLGRRLNAEVEMFDPFPALQIRSRNQPSPQELRSMALTLGLAISRLDPEAFALDLLPQRVKRRREFFRKGIYLYYAAATMLVALGLYAYRGIAGFLNAQERVRQEQALLERDRSTHELYEKRRERVEELRANVGALLERVYSGEDILRVLSVFKKKTPRNIHLVEMTVNPPRTLTEGEYPRGGTFQETRTLFVRGVANSRKSDLDAITSARQFATSLTKAEGGLFSLVEIVYLSPEEKKVENTFVKEFILMLEVGREDRT